MQEEQSGRRTSLLLIHLTVRKGATGWRGKGVVGMRAAFKENTLVTNFSLITSILDDLQQFCKRAQVMRLHTNDI